MPAVPKSKDAPDTLRPYLFHGVDLDWKPNGKEAVGECPWCGRDKFSVKIATGLWQCFVCAEGSAKGGGNATIFVRSLHKLGLETTKDVDYELLRVDRKLLDINTLKAWEVVKSPITGDWLIPGYSVESKVCNLYRYTPIKGKDGKVKNRLLLTPTLGHQLHGMNLWKPDVDIVDICEGPWDGMALWEAMYFGGFNEDGDVSIFSSGNSRLSDSRNVIAVPGTKTFFQSWVDLVGGKTVNLWYDSDKPKTLENGREVEPAGIEGVKRVSSLLFNSSNPPNTLNYIKWGEEGYDPDLPDGYDIRDALSQ